MHHAFRFVTGQFGAAANDRAAGEDLASWVRAKLVEIAEEAEIPEPVWEDDAWTSWLDIGGDRFRIATRRLEASEWLVAVEHKEPMFVRAHEGHARHQTRFDVLVAQLRRIILQAQGARLLAENDD
jgi:hypothetical protein